MTLGEKIQKLRKQRGLSQEALAEKVTVTRQTISNGNWDNLPPIWILSPSLETSSMYLLIT